jgi:hypothetical protein
VCTVLLRLNPDGSWPLLVAAVRDEFTSRAWDPPAAHWPSLPSVWGGRDRLAGGTWLAVDRDRPAVAALLNGVRRDPPTDGEPRPTRGALPLAALGPVAADVVPGIADAAALTRYDGFHLLRGDRAGVEVWSWDGIELRYDRLAPGDHIIVNMGVDRTEDPLVPHFAPQLAALQDPDPEPGIAPGTAWSGWIEMLRGDGLAPDDERGLIIDHEILDPDGVVHHYGSTSATLVGLRADGALRYDFTAEPAAPHWYAVV